MVIRVRKHLALANNLVGRYTNTTAVISRISFIDGEKGILRYRGYPIEELAERGHFLEVAHCVLYGDLPTQLQMDKFQVCMHGMSCNENVHVCCMFVHWCMYECLHRRQACLRFDSLSNLTIMCFCACSGVWVYVCKKSWDVPDKPPPDCLRMSSI